MRETYREERNKVSIFKKGVGEDRKFQETGEMGG